MSMALFARRGVKRHQSEESWNDFFRTNGQQLLLLRFLPTRTYQTWQQNGNLIKISRKSVVFEAFIDFIEVWCGWENCEQKPAQDVACKLRRGILKGKIFRNNWNRIEMLSHVVVFEDYSRLFVSFRSWIAVQSLVRWWLNQDRKVVPWNPDQIK